MSNPNTFSAICAQYGLPQSEALRLASWALSKPRVWFLAHDQDLLSVDQITVLTQALSRRAMGEPVAYIEGTREFYGLNLAVSPAVLIPRPETELLVDYVCKFAPPSAQILDLGTGSGAIAIALAHTRRDCHVVATDISATALAIAKHNAQQLVCNVTFYQGSWFEALATGAMIAPCLDVIVSNPPYIHSNDPHLNTGDLKFEPVDALTDHADGLLHYRAIIEHAKHWLNPQGFLVFEHGYQQGEALSALLKNAGYHTVVQHYDLDQQAHPRMIVAQQSF